MRCMQKIREEKNIMELFGDEWILWRNIKCNMQGRIQDFKLGWAHLKKIVPSGGRGEHFWGISCEKSRFHAKKSYFFPIPEEGAKIVRVFHVKNHDFMTKIIFFPILGRRALPWIHPWYGLGTAYRRASHLRIDMYMYKK